MRIIIFFIIISVIGIATYFFINFTQSPVKTSATTTPTVSKQAHCTPDQLNGAFTAEPAAGNIYATLVLTNTSTTSCSIILGQTITAKFQANNITLTYKPAPTPFEFTLKPNDKVYSQVHYPNGPQCSSPPIEKTIRFAYEVDGESVPFQETNTNREGITIQSCSAASDITTITIWPLSLQQISQ